ncbi:hypothetical protein WJX72_011982 [[Myrmecia] bisecta]|uniref:AP2/ERF domain-containing protein n=1 Tax=[Myrmecia] bisecta TaxID=41462 RepID=A0AAW1Q7C4_9CHLO
MPPFFQWFTILALPSTAETNLPPQGHEPDENYKSKYRGVTYHKAGKRWRCSIKVEGRKITLGSFPSEDEAAQAFDNAALRYRGPSTSLNFPSAAQAAPVVLDILEVEYPPNGVPIAGLPSNGRYLPMPHLAHLGHPTRKRVKLEAGAAAGPQPEEEDPEADEEGPEPTHEPTMSEGSDVDPVEPGGDESEEEEDDEDLCLAWRQQQALEWARSRILKLQPTTAHASGRLPAGSRKLARPPKQLTAAGEPGVAAAGEAGPPLVARKRGRPRKDTWLEGDTPPRPKRHVVHMSATSKQHAGKWKAQIVKPGMKNARAIGYYDTEEEALEAFQRALEAQLAAQPPPPPHGHAAADSPADAEDADLDERGSADAHAVDPETMHLQHQAELQAASHPLGSVESGAQAGGQPAPGAVAAHPQPTLPRVSCTASDTGESGAPAGGKRRGRPPGSKNKKLAGDVPLPVAPLSSHTGRPVEGLLGSRQAAGQAGVAAGAGGAGPELTPLAALAHQLTGQHTEQAPQLQVQSAMMIAPPTQHTAHVHFPLQQPHCTVAAPGLHMAPLAHLVSVDECRT